MSAVRVLVVDDSPLCRAAVRVALEEVPGFEPIAEARDGRAAVELTERLRPDVVVMDVHMPRMNGLDAVEQIMARAPTPILVLSGDPAARSGALAYEALRRGAIDLLAKDELARSHESRAILRDRLRFLATVPVVRHLSPRGERLPAPPRARGRAELVAVVASTGGPAALAEILRALPPGFEAPLLIVQHLRPSFVDGLAAWLDAASPLRVAVARRGQAVAPGLALLAPDGAHLELGRDGRVELRPASDASTHCPSGDALLRSVARSAGPRALGVVLTGMGSDGAEGLCELRRAGGETLVQDEASSVVHGMPRAARALDPAHPTAPLGAIAQALVDACGGRR
ncbi:MAG: chemotaxis-specific protein-glutamate methyltransferase CheB [Sandaracinaceae bacterium]|nr:chemotaxis-specific protein-glutamate methyltransferase CheB [Sandaracinaceae bacterium]